MFNYSFIYLVFGFGGLSKCEGTSNDDVIKNQAICNQIISCKEVSSLYQTYTLEDGNMVCIDRHYVTQRVR